MTTYWAVPMYKFLGYRDTILDKYEPLKVRGMILWQVNNQSVWLENSWVKVELLVNCSFCPHPEIPGWDCVIIHQTWRQRQPHRAPPGRVDEGNAGIKVNKKTPKMWLLTKVWLQPFSFYGSTGTKNLEAILESLLLAGTDTVSAFLEWFCMYMTRDESEQKILTWAIQQYDFN